MIRPQQKQRKQHENRSGGLKRGDEIVTSGGIVGEVIHIRETRKDGGANRLDDRVTIKSGESRLIVETRTHRPDHRCIDSRHRERHSAGDA